MTGHRLKVRIGDSEFEAEGSEESVKSQYDLFLRAVEAAGTRPLRTPTPLAAPPARGVSMHPIQGAAPQLATSDNPPDEALVKRAFKTDAKGNVSLRTLPRTDNSEADALVLLIYGHQLLRGEHDIGGTPLLAAARQSGLNTLVRVDYAVAERTDFVTRGGYRRGVRYGLNNRGVLFAKGLLERLFD